jgi:hypothetical protein
MDATSQSLLSISAIVGINRSATIEPPPQSEREGNPERSLRVRCRTGMPAG